MQATQSLPSKLSDVGTGIPLPRLSKAVETLKVLESRSDLLPTPPTNPMSASKAFVPMKLKLRRVLTFLFRVKRRNRNFI